MNWKELKNKIKWTKKKAIISVVVIGLLIVAFAFFPQKQAGYSYMEIKQGPYSEKILAVGQLGPEGQRLITAEVAGKIDKIGGRDGGEISEGAVLVSIYNPDRDFILAQKQSGYLDAQQQYNSLLEVDYPVSLQEVEVMTLRGTAAGKDYQDAQYLYQEGAISKNELLSYENAYKDAVAQQKEGRLRAQALAPGGSKRESSKYKMEAAKAIYDGEAVKASDYLIKAEMDTLILKSYIQMGDSVNPGDPLMDVGRVGRYLVNLELDEKYLLYVKEGMKADITIEGGETLTGIVETISPKVNKNTGTFDLSIGVERNPDYPASDLTVNVEIIVTEKDSAMVIPKQYITERGTLFIYSKGKAEEKALKLWMGPGPNAILESGLKSGDILLLPDSTMENGQSVQLQKGADRV